MTDQHAKTKSNKPVHYGFMLSHAKTKNVTSEPIVSRKNE